MNERPNLLFVFADQLRASCLPLYGENQIETPNLDRLASEGVTLDNCVSTCPVCTPYRAMLITGSLRGIGQYPAAVCNGWGYFRRRCVHRP